MGDDKGEWECNKEQGVFLIKLGDFHPHHSSTPKGPSKPSQNGTFWFQWGLPLEVRS